MTKLLILLLLSCLLFSASCTSKYKVTGNLTTSSTITLNLTYTGTDQYYVKATSPIVKSLTFVFRALTLMDFDVKIYDTFNKRFEVPQELPFPVDPFNNGSVQINLAAFKIDIINDPFDFTITRKHNNATLFSTTDGELIFSNYYLQITTQVDTEFTYGLGERFNQNFRTQNGKWTIFNRDRGQGIDRGTGQQTYGYYPLYLQRQNQHFFHVNYLRSSNAMDVIREQKNNKTYLTYKVIGGIFDFRFFMAEQSAEAAVEKLHGYMGRAAIPPFWSLGFHQCRWGYKNISYLQYVLKAYESNNLPLDVIWSDIDYMVDYQDFTINSDLFPLDRMKAITDKYHYIPIIDAGIKVNEGPAYTQGKARNVFVKDANGSELRGRVWPGTTTFVDFFQPNATTYWGDMLDLLYEKVKFSGIWLDMNEYANFCDGPCEAPSQTGFDYSKDIPYNPGSDSIQSHTISLNATHYGDRKQADVHAFGAFLETYATNLFLKSKGLRPFIISRSSTLGSNKFGFHWTGDNYASFQFLRSSIADNFLNQIFGFQMVGPDICGFGGNTTEQLCSRWFQLGSLYTFTRNHNDYGSISQQPYALGAVVLKAAQTNLKLRYSLLKHYFSLFINKRGIGTIYNPLYYIFPLDNNNYIDDIVDTHVLIGSNLLIAPILEKGVTSRNVYFSTVNWVNSYTGKEYKAGTARIDNVQLTDAVPLFLRENTLILTQNVDNVKSTKDLDNKFNLNAAFYLEQRRSNETHKFYSSIGSHISLDDYDNNTKIDTCLNNGCEYVFTCQLEITPTARILQITVSYAGAFGLNGQMIINQVTLLYDGQRVSRTLASPLTITGGNRFSIQIKDQDKEQHLRTVDV